jgi:hypothetical protein
MPTPGDDLSRRVARLERRRPCRRPWSIAAIAIVALASATLWLWSRARPPSPAQGRTDRLIVHHYALPGQDVALTYGSDGEGREIHLQATAAPPPTPPPAAAPPVDELPSEPSARASGTASGAPIVAPTPTVVAGSITGVVTFTGPIPDRRPQRRDADAFCARTRALDESILVNDDHTLRNVIVRITNAPATAPPPTQALVEQRDCNYRPHVQCVVAGQVVDLRNGDQTLHNIHTYRGAATLFNQAQLPGVSPILKTFDAKSPILKLKCDVHPWMTGYLLVQPNAWCAATDDTGRFTLAHVPPGRWTLEAWHERLGTKQAEILVGDSVTEATFSYSGAESGG